MTHRTAPILAAALVVVGLVAAVPLGNAMVHDGDEAAGDSTATRPGEQLSGVVGVQGAELGGEVESRAFGIAVADAETDEARADVIAAQFERDERRLAALETRQAELREQRDAGEIEEGTYRARVAVTVAQAESVRQTTGQGAAAAGDLPDEVREDRGVDPAAIATLQERADRLTGPEIAAIARGIAGESVGAPVGAPDERQDGGRSDGDETSGATANGGRSTASGNADDRAADTPTPTR